MDTKRQHSIKVPRLYKVAAQIHKDHVNGKGSIKTLIYDSQKKHPNVKAIFALVSQCVNRRNTITTLIEEADLLNQESRFDPDLAKILITELFFGKKTLAGESVPVKTILKYKKKMKGVLKRNEDVIDDEEDVHSVKPRFVRINVLKCELDEMIRDFQVNDGFCVKELPDSYDRFLSVVRKLKPHEFIRDFHVENVLVFPPKTRFYDHGSYLDGRIILQDKASCLPVTALKIPNGSVVLDACAAPGMKTTHIAARIGLEGIIYAVERDRKRCETLKTMISKTGADSIVRITHADFLELDPFSFPDVQYIVLDPSCSGSGIMEQDAVSEERLEKLANLQIKMLLHAMKFPHVVKISYSTCSIYDRENEQVVTKVLETNRDFKLAKSLKNWRNRGADGYPHSSRYIRADFKTDLCTGFFVAILKRR